MVDQMVLQTQQWLNKTYGNDSRFKKSIRTAELVGRQSMRLLAHCRLNWASSPLPITSVLPPSGIQAAVSEWGAAAGSCGQEHFQRVFHHSGGALV